MASYDNIDTLVHDLKRSAIDAYMYKAGFKIGDAYYESSAPLPLGPANYLPGSPDIVTKVTRPDQNGDGGGEVTLTGGITLLPGVPGWYHGESLSPDIGLTNLPDFVSQFEQIRGRIDRALKGWLDLPDPKLLDDSLDICRNTIRSVIASEGSVSSGGTSGDTVQVAGSIGSSITNANENAEDLSGSTMETFKANVLGQIPRTVSSLDLLAIVLGGAMVAEQKAMETARQATADLVDATRQSFEKLVGKIASARFEISMKFLSAVADTAGSFVSGGKAEGALGAVANILEFAYDVHDINEEYFGNDGDFDGIMASLENGLTEINHGLKETEEAIDRNLQKNHEIALNDNKGDFKLTLDAINSEDVDENAKGSNPDKRGLEALVIDITKVEGIYQTHLPNVASEIGNIKDSPLDLNMAMYRDEGIGLDPKGPTNWFFNLTNGLRSLLRDLETKIRWAAKELELVVDVIYAEDDQVADAMQRLDYMAGDNGIYQRNQREEG